MARKPRPPNLPDFKRPPVSEVVLSVQFRALEAFGNAHAGLLWHKFRREYPDHSEQSPLQPVFETFGSAQRSAANRGLQIETLLSPPMSRFWFLEADGRELIQVQQDRFIHNWRKRGDEQLYPRYETIRERFGQEIRTFERFVQEEMLGDLKPNQCEVTYINVIEFADETEPFRALQRVTPLWAGQLSEHSELEFDSNTIGCRCILRESDRPIGRIHARFVPAHRALDERPVVRLEITARARPTEESLPSAFSLLDRERQEIVRFFAAVTTPEMHQLWERTDGR
jgi:uncharacterized protein (TIGR04255 family)